jgi:hypothetical protein
MEERAIQWSQKLLALLFDSVEAQSHPDHYLRPSLYTAAKVDIKMEIT